MSFRIRNYNKFQKFPVSFQKGFSSSRFRKIIQKNWCDHCAMSVLWYHPYGSCILVLHDKKRFVKFHVLAGDCQVDVLAPT